MPKSKHDRTTVASRRAPGPGESGPRRRARGQVSGISIPGLYRWRLDEAIVDAFLARGPLPVSRSKLGL
jgi:hypothetical protein